MFKNIILSNTEIEIENAFSFVEVCGPGHHDRLGRCDCRICPLVRLGVDHIQEECLE